MKQTEYALQSPQGKIYMTALTAEELMQYARYLPGSVIVSREVTYGEWKPV